MEDTKLGRSKKDDPVEVARVAYEALMDGNDPVIAVSFKNKAQVAAATILPDKAVAAAHGTMAEPGSGDGGQHN